ncbi:MAG: response regulator [Spirochaetes bacterium]|nr:response regulator [Spirochaetota bacterium]
MGNEPLILVIEDERPIRNFLKSALQTQSYRVLEAGKGKEGVSLAASHVPDIILLDLGLPDMDGIEVIKELRAWYTAPILILSARGQERDKIAALDAGADDYLTKPFGVGELLARIRVALRNRVRREMEEGGGTVFSVGGLKVDLEARRVFIDGEEVHLTPIEFKLLSVLVKNAGKVVTHMHLLREVWGPASTDQLHYVRIYMAGLRKKLEKDPARPRYLLTEVGVGYRLVDE